MVADKSFDITRVITIPRMITQDKIAADNTEEKIPVAPPTQNMVIMAIIVGKRPLHGTKLFVIMAIRRSLGESMIRQPMIPAALQPNPMHMTEEIYAGPSGSSVDASIL